MRTRPRHCNRSHECTILRCRLNKTRWSQTLLWEVPPPDIYPKAEKTNLNVENARVKCTLPPHVVSAVVVLVTTDVEAHGITA